LPIAIALGEIEAILNQHSNVRQAIVAVQPDRQNQQSIVAYFIQHERSQTEAEIVEQLRCQLRAKLPGYMMPAAFVCLSNKHRQFPTPASLVRGNC
jgi:acyl-coenzyme A synthetase/AMP-(fatty) acid ligase